MAEADNVTVHTKVKRRKGMPGKDTKPCGFDGCRKWPWAQGYCDSHYQKLTAGTGQIGFRSAKGIGL